MSVINGDFSFVSRAYVRRWMLVIEERDLKWPFALVIGERDFSFGLAMGERG